MIQKVNFNTSKYISKSTPSFERASIPNDKLTFEPKTENKASTGFVDMLLHPITSVKLYSKIRNIENVKKYMDINAVVDNKTKEDLKILLDKGYLLSNDTDNKTTMLYNLHRIIVEPKASGLDSVNILTSAINNTANSFIIDQGFGDITPRVAGMIMKDSKYNKTESSDGKTFPAEYNLDSSGTCVAASMEFNLANKRPAEYARYAADLSSPKMCVEEKFKFSDISENTMEALHWLEEFNLDYEAEGFEGGIAKLRPDPAAIYRAISQTENRKSNSRSALDTLMQSMFMQLGSGNAYNTLTDVNSGKFNTTKGGLTELEKTFAESIVDDKGGIMPMSFQVVDDQGYLVGYNQDTKETKKEIVDSLQSGSNVIAGITYIDNNGKIKGGHELALTKYFVGSDGKERLEMNDSDDGKHTKVVVLADEFIPKIHHAGLPNTVMKQIPTQNQKPDPIIQIPPSLNTNNKTNIATSNSPKKAQVNFLG